MEQVKEILNQIISLTQERKDKEAFACLKKHIATIQGFLVFISQNHILSEEDVNNLAQAIVQAMENEDAILLEDVMDCGIYNVYKQLFEGEEDA